MRLLVTGGSGMLGTAVTSAALERGFSLTSLARRDLDVTDRDDVRRIFGRERPEVVVHCAAFTAVDAAEDEPTLAMEVNLVGTRNVVAAADQVGARVVYPSTDYVFDGRAERPYRPGDPPNPLSVYGRSKWAGEQAVREGSGPHLIARTSWLYGAGGRNFVDTMRELAESDRELRVVDDQRGRPTWTRSLADTLLDLIGAHATGTVHVSGGGEGTTWFALARTVFDMTGAHPSLHPVSTAEYGARAPRPPYSLLDLTATETLLQRPLPHWRDSLERYLGEPA